MKLTEKEMELVMNARKHNGNNPEKIVVVNTAEKDSDRDANVGKSIDNKSETRRSNETFELVPHQNIAPVTTEKELQDEDQEAIEQYELIKCANCDKIFKIINEPIPAVCPFCKTEWKQ